MRHSLQNKIFFFFVALLVVVQGIALYTINRTNQARADSQIQHQLDLASTVIGSDFRSRSYYLRAFSETVAKDYGLKNVFQDDRRSFLVALNNHRARIEADLAFTLALDGKVVHQLLRVTREGGKERIVEGPDIGRVFFEQPVLGDNSDDGFHLVDNILYQVTWAPIKSGSQVFAWIGFGFAIDRRLANQFAGKIAFHVNLMLQGEQQHTLLASSNKSDNQTVLERIIKGESLPDIVGKSLVLGKVKNKVFVSVLYRSKADLLQAIKRQWLELVSLASVTLLLSLLGAYFISRGITRPIKRLVQQAKVIAGGNYEQEVGIDDAGELGQLAGEIKLMQKAVLSREREISHRVYHDPLTELPNRNALLGHIEQDSFNTIEHFGLYLINIKHIKDVNDSMGYDAGDQLICQFASRLQQLSQKHFVAHLGADDFALLDIHSHTHSVQVIVNAIDALLKEPFTIDCLTMYLHVRVGIAFFPQHGQGVHLLQKADTALHLAKIKQQAFMQYDADLDKNTLERLNLISDLKQAIHGDELVLFYQPKVNLSSRRVTHVEALVRWQHPELGMVPPDKFIAIAEQTGQINALTAWVMNEAGRQYAAWKKDGIQLSIAVNISAQDLNNEQFYVMFQSILKQYRLPVNALTLEVTESAVLENPERAIAILQRFKAQGVHLSIDDYGTGYSSLAQLKQLPLHELKIDKSFVQRLPGEQDDCIIVQSTIELSHNMGLSVVAEGVETEDALEWLAEKSCELAQGYYISKPLPAQELTTWLLKSEYFESVEAESSQ